MGLATTVSSQGLSDADRQAIAHYSAEFIEAARYGELDDLQLMFGHKQLCQLIDFPNLVDPESHTSPLMYAAANGCFDCVQFLINTVEVSVDRPNNSGNTPLHWAALNGHVEVVDFLISHGANVFTKNNFGQTSFDEAFVRDKKDCCERIAREECRILKERGDEDDEPMLVSTAIDRIDE